MDGLLKCPCCGKYMTMKDIGDSVKQLECAPCRVTKSFKSWGEQAEFEKIYDSACTSDEIQLLNKRIEDLETLVKMLRKEVT